MVKNSVVNMIASIVQMSQPMKETIGCNLEAICRKTAVQRANRNKFDAFAQTQDRLNSLFTCGHKCDKLEFILEGGTFTEYPKPYLIRFFRDFIYCCNVYFETLDKSKALRDKLSLQEEVEINKTAKCRIIGICIETRPDSVLDRDEDGDPWIKTLLSWEVTRIQLGMQHIDNKILKKLIVDIQLKHRFVRFKCVKIIVLRLIFILCRIYPKFA